MSACYFFLSLSLSPPLSLHPRIREGDFNDVQQFKQNDSQRWNWYFWWLPDKVKTLTLEWKRRTGGWNRSNISNTGISWKISFFWFHPMWSQINPGPLFLTFWTTHSWNLYNRWTNTQEGASLVAIIRISVRTTIFSIRPWSICQWRGFLLRAVGLVQSKEWLDGGEGEGGGARMAERFQRWSDLTLNLRVLKLRWYHVFYCLLVVHQTVFSALMFAYNSICYWYCIYSLEGASLTSMHMPG